MTNEHSSAKLASTASKAFALRGQLKAAIHVLKQAEKMIASLAGSVLTQARDKSKPK
jgi:hypothetical protein